MELKIENLTKAYGKKVALKDFSATLSNGIYGLLGPNGAGKSTMMKIITYEALADGLQEADLAVLYTRQVRAG